MIKLADNVKNTTKILVSKNTGHAHDYLINLINMHILIKCYLERFAFLNDPDHEN